MKKISSILLFAIVFFTFQSCQTVKEGFTSQKKKSTDEFLVEKKSPLVMPPEFNELPVPKSSENIPEIVFWGRSNVGKSSLINSITNSSIAKTSKTPGRTRSLVFFQLEKRPVSYTHLTLPTKRIV